MHLAYYVLKLPNLKLKTRPQQVLGSLKLDIVLPAPGVGQLVKSSSVAPPVFGLRNHYGPELFGT
jgi:hypothetical protein